MRGPDGSLIRVDPDRAAEAIEAGAKDVTEDEVTRVDALRDPSIVEALEAAGAGALAGASDVAQTLHRGGRAIAQSPLGRAALGAVAPGADIAARGLEAGLSAAEEATGTDLTDPSRSLPAQAVGVVGGAASALAGEDFEDARAREEARYTLEDRRLSDAHPLAYGAGTVAGEMAAGAALTPGFTGLGMAARGGAQALGAGAKLARTVGGVVSGGAEGAFYGVATAEREARLAGQTDGATAEQLMIGIGLGSILGGAIGGATEGIGALLSPVVEDATGALKRASQWEPKPAPIIQRAEAATQEAAEAAAKTSAKTLSEELAEGLEDLGRVPGNKLVQMFEDLQVAVTGADRQAIREFGLGGGAQAQAKRAVLRNIPKARREATDQFTRAALQLEDSIEWAQRHWGNHELKADDIRPQIDVDLLEAKGAGIRFGRQFEEEIGKTADNIAARYADVKDKTEKSQITQRLNLLIRSRDHLKRSIDAAADGGDAADVFVALESAKRAFGNSRKSLQRQRTNLGPTADEAHDEVMKASQDLYEHVRNHLMDTQTWGRAGEAQRRVNAAWEGLLKDEELYRNAILRDQWKRDWETGDIAAWVDPAKVEQFVGRVGKYQGDPLVEALSRRLENAQALLGAMRDYMPSGQTQGGRLTRAIRSADDMKATLKKSLEQAGIANRFEEGLMQPEKLAGGLAKAVSPATLGLVGGLTMGPLAGIAGLASGAILRPGSTALMADGIREVASRVGGGVFKQAAAAVRRAGQETGSAAGKATESALSTETIGKVARGAARAGVEVVQGTARVVGATGRAARRVAIPSSIELFIGRHKDIEAAGEHRRRQLVELQQNPAILVKSLAARTGDLPDAAPEVAAELMAVTRRAVDYLYQTMPPAYGGSNLLDPGRKPVVAKSELLRWARAWSAIENPKTVLDDLDRGQVSPEQVKALRAVHPEIYQGIRQTVLGEIAKNAARGRETPLWFRQQLDVLLDLRGAGIPALSPKFAIQIDQYRAAAQAREQQQPPSRRAAPNLSAGVALPQQRWPSASRS